jgi:hypothetical protein
MYIRYTQNTFWYSLVVPYTVYAVLRVLRIRSGAVWLYPTEYSSSYGILRIRSGTVCYPMVYGVYLSKSLDV